MCPNCKGKKHEVEVILRKGYEIHILTFNKGGKQISDEIEDLTYEDAEYLCRTCGKYIGTEAEVIA